MLFSWPVVPSLKEDMDRFLREVMDQHPWRDPNERDETDAEAEAKKGQSIGEWVYYAMTICLRSQSQATRSG